MRILELTEHVVVFQEQSGKQNRFLMAGEENLAANLSKIGNNDRYGTLSFDI